MGCVGFGTRIFKWKKIKEYDAKKMFANWLRVSGSKLHVAAYWLKNGLNNDCISKYKIVYAIKRTSMRRGYPFWV